jgi:hypothetical protein
MCLAALDPAFERRWQGFLRPGGRLPLRHSFAADFAATVRHGLAGDKADKNIVTMLDIPYSPPVTCVIIHLTYKVQTLTRRSGGGLQPGLATIRKQ